VEQVESRAHHHRSEPASARQAADAAVKALDWKLPYFCDADHITL